MGLRGCVGYHVIYALQFGTERVEDGIGAGGVTVVQVVYEVVHGRVAAHAYEAAAGEALDVAGPVVAVRGGVGIVGSEAGAYEAVVHGGDAVQGIVAVVVHQAGVAGGAEGDVGNVQAVVAHALMVEVGAVAEG